jgi:hypothetical protein
LLFGGLRELRFRRQEIALGAPAAGFDPQMAADMPRTLVDVPQDIVGERPRATRLIRCLTAIASPPGSISNQMVAVALAERDFRLGRLKFFPMPP